MIYLGTKFVVGIFRFAFPRFIGSILPYFSRRKQKCLLTRPRSTQVPWLLENQPFAPAAPGMARERRRAASTRLGKNHHRETMRGAGAGTIPLSTNSGQFYQWLQRKRSCPVGGAGEDRDRRHLSSADRGMSS